VTAEHRLAKHRGPLDLEQEGDSASHVPDAVDLGQVVDGSADRREVSTMFALVEPISKAVGADPP
jgi:hypothetical protein